MLSITQRRGVTSLIPNKKDPLNWKNWRPLSLLNQDNELLAKLIVERIKPHMKKIINIDQTGFIKGRYIGQNITNIIDILHCCEQEDISGVLISVDFVKAFDSLDWVYIDKSLKFFNVPDTIHKWVRILYNDISSCVINNEWASNYFKLERGVRQGCPLSPYLFIIAAETLALKVRQNNDIQGIQIGNKTFKIKQYAYDTQVFSLFEIFKVFEEFSTISGLQINCTKTEVLRIGAIKHTAKTIETNEQLKWTNDYVDILWITVSTTMNEMIRVNIDPLI